MSIPTLAGRTVLITGASKGLGLAVTEALLASGCYVYALARGVETLTSLQKNYPQQCIPISTDITDPRALWTQAQKLSDKGATLDTLILNAGTCEYVDANNFSRQPFNNVFNLNLNGNIYLLEAFLPLLQQSQNAPHIVGISSLVTELPLPRSEAYGASKAGFDYLLRSLRTDLYRKGVDVSVIKPGFIKTPLTARNDFAMPFLMDAQAAADHILKAVVRRKNEYRFPWQLSLLMQMLKVLPTSTLTRVLQKTVKK